MFDMLALTVLIGLSVLSIVFGNDWIGYSLEGDLSSNAAVPTSFNIDPLTGAIGILITIAVIGALFGLQLLDSGLNTQSVKFLIMAIGYAGLWLLFSMLAYDLIIQIEIFGALIYTILTIMYVVGILKRYSK